MASQKLKVYKAFLALEEGEQQDVLEFIKDALPKKTRKRKKVETAAAVPVKRKYKRKLVIIEKAPVEESPDPNDETGD